MKSFFNSLFWKISALFLLILIIISGVYMYISVFTAEMYFQETRQKLDLFIAEHIAKEYDYYAEGELNEDVIKEVFHNVMVINPSIEVYLLDKSGKTLGAVLYEMLTGIRPFEAATEEETLRRIRELQLEPPSQHNSEVDPALDQIVLRALARDPAQRFPQVAELQVALSQILHRRWPDFTASTLATSLKELFGWEIAQLEGQGGDTTRDRLLFQLSRAGVKIDPGKATTSDLLEMGTVAIAGQPPRQAPSRWRRLAPWIGGGAAVLLLFAGGLALWSIGSGDVQGDAGVDLERTPPAALSTEHLVPASIQAPAEPELPPSAPSPKAARGKVAPIAVRAQRAFLNCNSWPWSVVFLNGRRLPGNTPLFRVKVPAGKHRLRFSNPELGLSKEVAVTLTPGETKTVAVSLQQ